MQNLYKNKAINLIIKDSSKITLLTINGYIKITRNVLIPADSNSLERLKELYGAEIKSIVPLDMVLGIWNMPFKVTPAMMLVISHTAISQCSYQKTEECIESLKKIKIGDDTIRKIVNYIGKIIFEKECKIVDKNIEDDKFGKFPKNYNIDGVLYAEADGCFLCTQNLVTKKREWREIRNGLVFNSLDLKVWKSDNGKEYHKIEKKEYISHFGCIDEFKRHFYALMLRNGYGKFKETVILGNGATWIKNFKKEYVSNSLQILDFYHVYSNMSKFADFVFKSRDEREEKLNIWIRLLLDGEIEILLSELYKYRDLKCPEGIVNIYTYISNNLDSINYKYYREKGYLIGSGGIEGANKSVIQERLKLQGTKWIRDNAHYVAILRAKYCSDRWYSDVVKRVLDYFDKINRYR